MGFSPKPRDSGLPYLCRLDSSSPELRSTLSAPPSIDATHPPNAPAIILQFPRLCQLGAALCCSSLRLFALEAIPSVEDLTATTEHSIPPSSVLKQLAVAIEVLTLKLGFSTMNIDIKYFKQDIDELIGEFTQDESTTLADMKRVWLSRKFSHIYEARPATNLGFFMQSLYAHCIGYIVGTASLSPRLGGLYCLYCLYETQPFKPSFKVYLSLGELKKLRILVADAKANDINVAPAIVKRMLERNAFLFGSVDLMEGSVAETVNELQQLQNARIQVAYEKLFDNTSIDNYIQMDLGVEVDLSLLKEKSSGYAAAKNVAIQEASKVLDVKELKHMQEGQELIGDVVEKVANDWHVQKQTFNKQTGLGDDDNYEKELEQLLLEQDPHD